MRYATSCHLLCITLSPANNASLALHDYLPCPLAMSTASEWRLSLVAKCAQDTTDRSAYPAQIERQLTISRSNLWPKQTHSNGVVPPKSSHMHESIQVGWAADENAKKSCVPRYKYAGRNYGLKARDVHFYNWCIRRVALQTGDGNF